MCGIFGVVNTVNSEHAGMRDYMLDAVIAGAVRGVDSTGIFSISKRDNKKTSIFYDKAAMNGTQFLQVNDGNGGILLRQSGRNFITIGHHRAATRGEVTDDNAHPFLHWREDSTAVVGVHNGTLNNWNAKEDGRSFHVDSNWLYYKLAHAEKVEEQLAQFNGALALAWHDTRHPGKLFLYTNGGRPLSIAFLDPAYTKGPVNKMLIASEAGMMSWLAKRNNIDLLDNKILNLRPRHLYTFDATKDVSLLGYTVTEIKEAPRSSTVTTFQGQSWRRAADGVYERDTDHETRDARAEFESDIAFAVRAAIARAKQEADTEGDAGAKKDGAPAVVRSLVQGLTPEQRDRLDKEIWDHMDDDLRSKENAAPTVSTRRPAATPEQMKALESLGIKPGTEVTFDAVIFDPLDDGPDTEDPNTAGAILGDVVIESIDSNSITREVFAGSIQYVTRRRFSDLENKTVLCRIVGVIRRSRSDGGDLFLLTPPHEVLTIWPDHREATTH